MDSEGRVVLLKLLPLELHPIDLLHQRLRLFNLAFFSQLLSLLQEVINLLVESIESLELLLTIPSVWSGLRLCVEGVRHGSLDSDDGLPNLIVHLGQHPVQQFNEIRHVLHSVELGILFSVF